MPYEITSFPVTDPVARALGAQDLDAQEAVKYAFGAVMRFADVTLTIARSLSTSIVPTTTPRWSMTGWIISPRVPPIVVR
jgi:hypothetical protein